MHLFSLNRCPESIARLRCGHMKRHDKTKHQALQIILFIGVNESSVVSRRIRRGNLSSWTFINSPALKVPVFYHHLVTKLSEEIPLFHLLYQDSEISFRHVHFLHLVRFMNCVKVKEITERLRSSSRVAFVLWNITAGIQTVLLETLMQDLNSVLVLIRTHAGINCRISLSSFGACAGLFGVERSITGSAALHTLSPPVLLPPAPACRSVISPFTTHLLPSGALALSRFLSLNTFAKLERARGCRASWSASVGQRTLDRDNHSLLKPEERTEGRTQLQTQRALDGCASVWRIKKRGG